MDERLKCMRVSGYDVIGDHEATDAPLRRQHRLEQRSRIAREASGGRLPEGASGGAGAEAGAGVECSWVGCINLRRRSVECRNEGQDGGTWGGGRLGRQPDQETGGLGERMECCDDVGRMRQSSSWGSVGICKCARAVCRKWPGQRRRRRRPRIDARLVRNGG
jgi:hypothetical protein